MSFIKKIITLLLVFVLLGSSLSARDRVVEVWPGINYLAKWKINNNLPHYANMLNFDTINGTIYPIPTKLTREYIKRRFYINASLVLDADLKTFQSKIDDINKNYETFKDAGDPINAATYLLLEVMGKNTKNMTPSEYTAWKDSVNFVVENLVKFSFDKKYKGMDGDLVFDEILGRFLLELQPKGNAHQIVEAISKNDAVKYVLSKAFDIYWDYVLDIFKNSDTTITKFLKTANKELWANIGFVFEIINGGSNILNILYAINSLNSEIRKAEVKLYAKQFIFDYIYKYDMNIDKMVAKCDLRGKKIGKYKVSDDIAGIRPISFPELFITYGIANGFGNSLDVSKGEDIDALYYGAYTVLKLIEKYGDGGNLKVYLDVDNKTGRVSINKNSYFINTLYWSPPLKIIKKARFSDVPIFSAKQSLEMIFSYTKDRFHENKLTKGFPFKYRYLNYSSRHISTSIKKNAVTSKMTKINYSLLHVEKVVNYNGFVADKNLNTKYQLYDKLYTNIENLIIPEKNCNIVLDNKIIDIYKYITSGVINCNQNLNYSLYTPIDRFELYNIFTRYANILNSNNNHIVSIVNSIRIKEIFNKIKFSSPVRRQQLFKFLLELLQLKPQLNIVKNINSLQINPCKSTFEGCALKNYNITNGENPNGIVSLYTVLVMLDRIEKYLYEKGEIK